MLYSPVHSKRHMVRAHSWVAIPCALCWRSKDAKHIGVQAKGAALDAAPAWMYRLALARGCGLGQLGRPAGSCVRL
jgi:hypothetical protein